MGDCVVASKMIQRRELKWAIYLVWSFGNGSSTYAARNISTVHLYATASHVEHSYWVKLQNDCPKAVIMHLTVQDVHEYLTWVGRLGSTCTVHAP